MPQSVIVICENTRSIEFVISSIVIFFTTISNIFIFVQKPSSSMSSSNRSKKLCVLLKLRTMTF